MQASNFGGTFDQLFICIFYALFTDDASLLFYTDHGAKKSKNDQKLKSKGSCLNSSLVSTTGHYHPTLPPTVCSSVTFACSSLVFMSTIMVPVGNYISVTLDHLAAGCLWAGRFSFTNRAPLLWNCASQWDAARTMSLFKRELLSLDPCLTPVSARTFLQLCLVTLLYLITFLHSRFFPFV